MSYGMRDVFMDEDGVLHGNYAGGRYDWVHDGPGNVSPQQSRYHFSPYYLFRIGQKGPNGIKGADAVYTDRMQQWDSDKAGRALEKFTDWRTRPDGDPRTICQEAAEIYFGKGVKCVGYAVGGNLSNGFPYGIFFLRNVPAEAKETLNG